MNKLDEILQKLALELEVNELGMVMVTGETCREMLIKEAKQAIVDLIEGEKKQAIEDFVEFVQEEKGVADLRTIGLDILADIYLKKQKLQKLKGEI